MKRIQVATGLLVGIVFSVALSIAVSEAANVRRAEAMAQSAKRFLASLTPEQRAKAVFAFEDEERLNWHFVPRARKGLPLKEMSSAQRAQAQDLLKTGMGHGGYLKTTTIIELENVLREIEKGSGPLRDPELYYFSVFGDPAVKGKWGWRLEGHHIAFNFTIVGASMVATTPAFLGANPAEVREGPKKGARALAAEEDLARSLVQSLDEKQQAVAIVDKTAPRDIISFNSQKADPLTPQGVAFSQLNVRQKKMFESLIDEYLTRMPEDLANDRRQKMKKSAMADIHFAWAGSTDKNAPHYYRIQGPTFLVEYDNTQNNANHIHTAWRDFNGDFGRDLLREHLQGTPHQR